MAKKSSRGKKTIGVVKGAARRKKAAAWLKSARKVGKTLRMGKPRSKAQIQKSNTSTRKMGGDLFAEGGRWTSRFGKKTSKKR